ncbi:MAG TPA: serine--tRNA ligase, partial [Dehalococcoidales bacterium]|nr:serine--tRNA ligase [Dehalococcoidales bacterium]
MFDLKLIRENPEMVRESLAHRKDSSPVDEIIKLDSERRQKVTQLEELRHARKGGKMAPEEGRKLRDQITALETATGELDARLKDM